MARIRTIKPELFTSDTLAQVSLEAERTFIGLLTQADDQGRLRDQAAMLNGALWPERPGHSISDMEADIDALIAIDLLCRYEAAGRKYLHIRTFRKHQRINRPSPSRYPECPEHITSQATAEADQDLTLVG